MTTTYGTTTGSAAGVGARVALTLLGAAGLIVGAFMEWTASIDGTKLAMKALWTTNFHTTETFLATVGFASIVVGLVAIVGLAIGSGWLTRLAGAVAVVGFILFAIEVYRSSADETQHFGLSSIAERCALIEGSLRLESMPGRGTTLLVELPLSESI